MVAVMVWDLLDRCHAKGRRSVGAHATARPRAGALVMFRVMLPPVIPGG